MITGGDLQGHWRRDWIKAPGFEDNTTRVHWMQAGEIFVDLRVPLERPDLAGATALADLGPSTLLALTKAEGFAGRIEVVDSNCTWHRAINWHGVPEADDIGLMSMDGNGLIEDGVLADYRERWLKVPAAPLRGHRFDLDGQTAFVIEGEAGFMFGIGPKPQGTSKPLLADLAKGHMAPEVAAQFASLYAIGKWSGADGIPSHATNPFCEGQPVLRRSGDGFALRLPGFDGTWDEVSLTP